VNYGPGTPEEAAAWVHYVNNVKKYNVRYWQVGSEPDSAWEDGGPLTAAMYAEKYLLFAKAMKAADPTIKVFGPLY
jgi:alpha-L-arabinofuranosidase